LTRDRQAAPKKRSKCLHDGHGRGLTDEKLFLEIFSPQPKKKPARKKAS
jgi:hypothetical protein